MANSASYILSETHVSTTPTISYFEALDSSKLSYQTISVSIKTSQLLFTEGDLLYSNKNLFIENVPPSINHLSTKYIVQSVARPIGGRQCIVACAWLAEAEYKYIYSYSGHSESWRLLYRFPQRFARDSLKAASWLASRPYKRLRRQYGGSLVGGGPWRRHDGLGARQIKLSLLLTFHRS